MSSNIHEVEQALLALNQRERATVIQRGIDSLEVDEEAKPGQTEIDSAWDAEARRRFEAVKNQTVQLLDVKDSHRQLRHELATRRKSS